MIGARVSAKSVLKLQLVIIGSLLVAHFLSQYFLSTVSYTDPASETLALLQKLNLNSEMALGSWYSGAILLLCAVLLAFIGLVVQKMEHQYVYHWFVLAAIFTYLSFDESVSIHELAVEPVKRMLEITSGPLYSAWVVPAIIVLISVSLFFIKFWLHLPRKTRWLFIVSLATFVGGAVIVEMISANQVTPGVSQSVTTPFWITAYAVEEGLELLGVSIFVYSLLDYISSLFKKDTFQLKFN